MLSSTRTVPARDINKPTAPRQRTSEGGIGQGKVIVISTVQSIEAAIRACWIRLTGQSDLCLSETVLENNI